MASKLHKAKHDRITMRNKLNCDSVCVSICQYCFIYIFSQSIVGYFNTLLSVTDRTDRENNQNTEQLNSCRKSRKEKMWFLNLSSGGRQNGIGVGVEYFSPVPTLPDE